MYCKRKYSLESSIKPASELLSQRWDGFGHTVAYFIHSKADVFLLTTFSSLVNVSIYSVYASVAAGLTLLLNTIATSVQSAFGNMIAKEEKETLKHNFRAYECLNNGLVMVLFSTAIVCVIPFMKLYTNNFTANGYINKNFSFLLLLAEASFCVRMPFQTIVLAAGHYKQTRNGAFVEAGINIGISILLVHRLGIIGVTIGTLSAMVFRTIQYILYMSKDIVHISPLDSIKEMCLDYLFLLGAFILSIYTDKIELVTSISNYIQWIIFAMIVFCVMSACTFLILLMMDHKSVKDISSIIARNVRR